MNGKLITIKGKRCSTSFYVDFSLLSNETKNSVMIALDNIQPVDWRYDAGDDYYIVEPTKSVTIESDLSFMTQEEYNKMKEVEKNADIARNTEGDSGPVGSN